MLRLLRRGLVGGAASAVAVLAGASVASAHIDPDPPSAPASSRLSVGFTVEHGCDGSATIQLDMRLPDGVVDPVAEPPPGWTGAITAGVVTFTGGPLPEDVEGTFRVAMTLPATPDTTIFFPFVQRCEVGEIRWIDIPEAGGGDELAEPAPAMTLTAAVAPPPTTPATTTAVSTTSTTTPAPSTTRSTPASTTTTSTASTASTSTASPTSSTSATSVGGGAIPPGPAAVAQEDNVTGIIVFAVVVAVLAGLGGLMIRQVRRAR